MLEYSLLSDSSSIVIGTRQKVFIFYPLPISIPVLPEKDYLSFLEVRELGLRSALKWMFCTCPCICFPVFNLWVVSTLLLYTLHRYWLDVYDFRPSWCDMERLKVQLKLRLDPREKTNGSYQIKNIPRNKEFEQYTASRRASRSTHLFL